MGGPLQEVLQRRRSQEGKGLWLRRGALALLLTISWLGLQFLLPASHPVIWFSFSVLLFTTYGVVHFKGRQRLFPLEFLLAGAVLLAGGVVVSGLPWLKMAFFPGVIFLGAFYPAGVVVPFSLLFPLVWLRGLIAGGPASLDILFSLSFVLTGATAALMFARLRRDRDQTAGRLAAIEERAREVGGETGMESLENEEVMAQYLASLLKTDDEIRELLLAAKEALFADSAHLFVLRDEALVLRCSTDEAGRTLITDGGAVHDVLKGTHGVLSGDLPGEGLEPGYLSSRKICSMISVPVRDDALVIGSLAVESSRYHAFTESSRHTVDLLARNIFRILERERVYLIVKRDVLGLQILRDGSSRLVSSLSVDSMIQNLCQVAERISGSPVYFFMGSGDRLALHYATEDFPGTVREFSFEKTALHFAIENRHTLYLVDARQYPLSPLPFRTGKIRSLMAVPVLSTGTALGLLVAVSAEVDFLNTFQRGLLEVLCNQAAISLANARLHAEIETLAVTDGLTGLYNHRYCKDRLAEELRRQGRTALPLSLLLVDIDHFKHVNDSYGHPVGDEVLRGVAKIIRNGIRDVDMPARYGGEEFALLLPGTDTEGARKTAERIRKATMGSSFPSNGLTVRVTVSIGIATAPADALDREDLIGKADAALYRAKEGGRNQCIAWSGVR